MKWIRLWSKLKIAILFALLKKTNLQSETDFQKETLWLIMTIYYQSKALISLSLNITIIITYKLLQAYFTDPDSPAVVVYYLSARELIDTKHPYHYTFINYRISKISIPSSDDSLYKSVFMPFSSKYMFWFSFLFPMPKCNLNRRSLMVLYLKMLAVTTLNLKTKQNKKLFILHNMNKVKCGHQECKKLLKRN